MYVCIDARASASLYVVSLYACMHVCMDVNVCMCMYVCMCMCVNMHDRICMYACMTHVFMTECTYVCMPPCMDVCVD